MEKIVRQSGSLSNRGVIVGLDEGIKSPECCDDGTMVNKTCNDLNKTFFKHFRTLEGRCNNLRNPLYGSKGSQLSRLLLAEHTKFEKSTFFEKPSTKSKLNSF